MLWYIKTESVETDSEDIKRRQKATNNKNFKRYGNEEYKGRQKETNREEIIMKNYTIAVAGTGYVGLSIATLLSQNHKVYAVDIIPEKVDLIIG